MTREGFRLCSVEVGFQGNAGDDISTCRRMRGRPVQGNMAEFGAILTEAGRSVQGSGWSFLTVKYLGNEGKIHLG